MPPRRNHRRSTTESTPTGPRRGRGRPARHVDVPEQPEAGNFVAQIADVIRTTFPILLAEFGIVPQNPLVYGDNQPSGAGNELVTPGGTPTQENLSVIGNPRRDTYEDFLHAKPPEYKGSVDPIVEIDWLNNMETIFQLCKCPNEKKTLYASKMLKDGAGHWWNTIMESMGSDRAEQLPWEEFRDLFMKHYLSPSQRNKLEEEFLNLKQGDMNVSEYTDKFNKKARFASHMVATEEEKARKFISGLRQEIQGPVVVTNLLTFQDTVEMAYRVEKQYGRSKKEVETGKRKWEEGSKEKGWKFKKFTSAGSQLTIGARSGSRKCYICRKLGHLANRCKIVEVEGKKPMTWGDQGKSTSKFPREGGFKCFKCDKEGHKAEHCRARQCYICQSFKHLANLCPKKGSGGSNNSQRPQLTQGVQQVMPKPAARAFQLTAKEAKEVADMVTGTLLLNSQSVIIFYLFLIPLDYCS